MNSLLLGDTLWSYSEPSFGEVKTVDLLIETLHNAGFQIEQNISGSPTMFMASYGTQAPVVGILAEYDADHKRSKFIDSSTLPKSDYVHAAGHNLLGVGALGGALAVKELIESGQLSGTIRYYGTTAEGGLGGRTFLARDGYFDDLDLSVFWHPSPVISANLSKWDAIIDFEIILPSGTKSKPIEQAIEIGHVLNELRKTSDSTQLLLNYVIDSRTIDVAQIADNVKLLVRIEHPDQRTALRLYHAIEQQVKTQNPNATINIFRAVQEFVPNKAANNLVQSNFGFLGDLVFSAKDEQYAQTFVKQLGRPYRPLQCSPRPYHPVKHSKSFFGYGSDIGDVSWFSPEMSFVVTCLPLGVNMSNWEGAIFAGHDIGKKGMLYAAKIIALSAIDYLSDPSVRDIIRKEFETRTSRYKYSSIIPSGPPDTTRNSKRTQ